MTKEELEQRINELDQRLPQLEARYEELDRELSADGYTPAERRQLAERSEGIEQLRRLRARLQAQLARLLASEGVQGESDVPPPQVQQMGGMTLTGPSVVLDEESILTGITGFIDIRYTVTQNGSRVAAGRLQDRGVIEINILRGLEYEVVMTGRTEIYDENLIMNDAYNGSSIEARWVVEAPAAGASGGNPSVELVGQPAIRPIHNRLRPDRAEWNILYTGINSSRGDNSQVGLNIVFSHEGSSGWGGEVSGEVVSGSYSSGATTRTTAALPVVLRFTHVSDPTGEAPATE